jgi:hypothetical protein
MLATARHPSPHGLAPRTEFPVLARQPSGGFLAPLFEAPENITVSRPVQFIHASPRRGALPRVFALCCAVLVLFHLGPLAEPFSANKKAILANKQKEMP